MNKFGRNTPSLSRTPFPSSHSDVQGAVSMVVEIRAQPDSVNHKALTVYRVDKHSRNVSELVDPDQNDRGRTGGFLVTKDNCHNMYIFQ